MQPGLAEEARAHARVVDALEQLLLRDAASDVLVAQQPHLAHPALAEDLQPAVAGAHRVLRRREARRVVGAVDAGRNRRGDGHDACIVLLGAHVARSSLRFATEEMMSGRSLPARRVARIGVSRNMRSPIAGSTLRDL